MSNLPYASAGDSPFQLVGAHDRPVRLPFTEDCKESEPHHMVHRDCEPAFPKRNSELRQEKTGFLRARESINQYERGKNTCRTS